MKAGDRYYWVPLSKVFELKEPFRYPSTWSVIERVGKEEKHLGWINESDLIKSRIYLKINYL